MQPLAQMGIVVARLPRQLGGRHAILERGIFQLRPLRARDDRLGELFIVEQVADALLVVAQESIHLRHVLDVDAGGSDERERGEAGGGARRPPPGGPAPQRTPPRQGPRGAWRWRKNTAK